MYKYNEYSYLSLLPFPAADTFNLISANYKSLMICLESCFTVPQHIASQCDFTCGNVSFPPCLSGIQHNCIRYPIYTPTSYCKFQLDPNIIHNTTPWAIVIDVHLFFMFFGKYVLIERDSSRPHCNHKCLALILCALVFSTAN